MGLENHLKMTKDRRNRKQVFISNETRKHVFLYIHTAHISRWKGDIDSRKTDSTDYRIFKSMHLQRGILMRMSEDSKKRKSPEHFLLSGPVEFGLHVCGYQWSRSKG